MTSVPCKIKCFSFSILFQSFFFFFLEGMGEKCFLYMVNIVTYSIILPSASNIFIHNKTKEMKNKIIYKKSL